METFDENEYKEYLEGSKKEDAQPSPSAALSDFDEDEFKSYAENSKPIEDSDVAGKKIGNSFGEYLGKKYKDGKSVLFQGTYGDAVINGEMTYEEAKGAYNVKALEGSLKYQDIGEIGWKDNFVQRGLGETAQATPYLVENTKRGTIGAIVGAGVLFAGSLVLDAVGVGAAIPDEIVTGGNLLRVLGLEAGKKYTAKQVALIAGSRIGGTVGMAPHMFKIERGQAYMGFREVGLSHEGSVKGANTYGLASAALEMYGWEVLAAPFKKAILKQGGEKAIKSIIGATAKEYGLTIGKETAVEIGQEETQLLTQALLAAAEHNPNAAVSKDDFLQAFQQTLLSAVAATSVFGAAGAAVNYKTFKTEMKKNLDIQLAEKEEMKKEVSAAIVAPEEAEDMAKTAEGEAKVQTVGALAKTETPPLKPEERAVVNKRVKELTNKIKKTDKEVAKLETEFTQLEKEGKSTTAIENKINQLIDEKDMAQAEINDVKSGKKNVADIMGEQIKVTPDKTLPMRKEQITSDIATTKQDIKDAETSLKFAKQGNKNTTKILERITTLNEKLDGLINEKAMIESGGLEQNDYRLPEAPDKGRVSLQRYRKQKVQELEAGISNYIKGVKTGISQQKIETKKIHSEIEGMLREAGVRINERGVFIPLLKNIQTVEQLAKNKQNIIDKVNQVFENRNKNAAVKQLGKFKKMAKKANITAETRNRINYLLGLTKMNDFDSGLRQKEIEDVARNENRPLTDAELEMLADLQVASGFRDDKGRFVRSSAELNQLNAEIAHLMETGRTLRQEYLQKIKQERINNINDAIDKISASKFADNKLIEMYNRSIANIGSLLNSLGGKEFMGKYDPEYQQGKMHEAIYMKNKDIKSTGEKIFNLDKYKLETKFKEMTQNKFFITLENDNGIKNVPRHISTWHIIDIYNSIKNEDVAKDYFEAYGEDQIMSLIDNLSAEEIQYADYMQKVIQEYYPMANEYNKLKTGKELTKRDNYWMATSDYMNEEYNALDTYRPIASVPSFLKKKSKSVVPIPQNSMQKMFKHITQSEYISHFEKTYTDLRNIFSEKNVRNLVEQKFGKNILQLVDREVEELSLNNRKQVISDFEKVMNGFLGKWAVAKVANPGVGIKQLAATFNYITGAGANEGMPVADFSKHLVGGMAHPKKTFDFMIQNSPLLETRYGSGYDDAVGLAISGAEGSTKGEQILTDALLSFTKMGDIGAIIYGGNAYVQYRISKGDSKEVAFQKFEQITNKTQQSNNPSSLSQLQKGRGVNFFMKFRNTSNQYARLIVEAQLQYMRGEISKLQHAKIIAMYAVVQPLLYTYLGAAIKDAGVQLAALFGGPDDDKKEATKLETFLDAMNMMATTLVEPIPILDELVDNAIRNSESYIAKQLGVTIDMPMYDLFKAQMLSDVAKGIKTLGTQLPRIGNEGARKPFNLAKTIYAFGLIQEPLTRIPVKLIFDTADIFSGGKVNKAMDKKKEKEYTNRKKKNDSMFADESSGSMFADTKEKSMFAEDKKSSMFADGK